MLSFVTRRLLVLVLTLAVVSVLAFLVPYLGGDAARTILRSRAADEALDPAAIAALSAELGLDRPLVVQYWSWLERALQGDFGLSFTTRTPVDAMFVNALSVSVVLALSALALAFVLALPIGTLAAMRPGRALDSAVTVMTQILVSIPEYWIGPILVLIFAIYLGWLPSAGWRDVSSTILPVLVLALRPLAYFTQVVRAAMIDVLNAPYIAAARGRGLSLPATLLRHGIRNSMLPIMTLFSLWLTSLLGGSVVVEVIFSVPGMGWLLYDAVLNNDVPLIQGSVVCIVAIAVGINTATDLAYALLNPAVSITYRAR